MPESTTHRDMTGAFPVAVPFLIGLRSSDGLLHAVEWESAQHATELFGGERLDAAAACVGAVTIARTWGEFRRDNPRIAGHRLCPQCAWTVALSLGREQEELAAVGPDADEESVWRRHMEDPRQLARIVEAILDDRSEEQSYDRDHPYWAQVLGHVCAHRPEVLVAEVCSEGNCDHEGGECPAGLACPTCSFRAGGLGR